MRRSLLLAARWGSSPLTRGLLTVMRLRVVVRGLIPADAGLTALESLGFNFETAHPR